VTEAVKIVPENQPFLSQPMNDNAVPTAAMYSVRELG